MKNFIATLCCSLLACVSLMAQSNAADQQFAKTAAEVNMTEAHLGQLAQDKAANAEIKDYGRELVQDHTTAYQDLDVIATKDGFTIPKGIDAQHEPTINRFKNLNGKNFDKQFLNEQVKAHQKALAEFRKEAQNGQNSDLKAYANKCIPKLEEHLQRAEKLQAHPNSSADRMQNPANGVMANSFVDDTNSTANANGKDTVHNGTITKYEPGKTLTLKMRGRLGAHTYDLSKMSANVPDGLSTGDKVQVTETVDVNGRRTITVSRANSQSNASTNAPASK